LRWCTIHMGQIQRRKGESFYQEMQFRICMHPAMISSYLPASSHSVSPSVSINERAHAHADADARISMLESIQYITPPTPQPQALFNPLHISSHCMVPFRAGDGSSDIIHPPSRLKCSFDRYVQCVRSLMLSISCKYG